MTELEEKLHQAKYDADIACIEAEDAHRKWVAADAIFQDARIAYLAGQLEKSND
jgi:hypothetical protein